MILGHTGCGAMKACINNIHDGHLKYLMDKIQPTYFKYKSTIDNSSNKEDELSRFNIHESARQLLEKSEIIQKALHEKKIEIVTAMYNLNDGKVRIEEILR
jgi:carbonic anhydrase